MSWQAHPDPSSSSCPTRESFAYDTIGNMTSKVGTALDYGTTAPKHAVKTHGSTTYTYDANGSMTARGTQTIKYDPEQRPILVQDGTSVHRATYDGDGVRRKRDDDNGTVHYLGGYERKLAGGSSSPETVTKYYSASLGALSRSVAFRRGGTLHWVGCDHLGGTIRVLDSGFTALDGMRYKPYGEDRDTGTSLNTDRKFTGQTEDEAAGLYWYASRAYDPAIGRFVSPDPIVPAPANPQSLNRYSYVYNNPLGFVDPSGNSAEWFNQAWRDEYRVDHGQYPGPSDYAFREWSMTNASRGLDSSVEQWVSTNYGTTTPEPRPAPTPERRPAPLLNVLLDELDRVAKDPPQFYYRFKAKVDVRAVSVPLGLDEQEENAVLHAYWSALLANTYGPTKAEGITDEHEQWNMERGQSKLDLAMDLYNNKVGRDIINNLPEWGWNTNTLLVQVLQAEREGILMMIVDGELKPTSPVNNALPLDVIASPHQFRQR